MNMPTHAEPYPYNTPPWRRSYKAASPDGLLLAEIADAREHSMSNPTVGNLRTSDGLELPRCSPTFFWSDDSHYLAAPQWIRRFGLFLRQRLAIVDFAGRTVYVSRFTYWLLQPIAFDGGRLEVLTKSSRGISWPWNEQPLLLQVPQILSSFTRLAVNWRNRLLPPFV
jgi:hypothetical protein